MGGKVPVYNEVTSFAVKEREGIQFQFSESVSDVEGIPCPESTMGRHLLHRRPSLKEAGYPPPPPAPSVLLFRHSAQYTS